MTFIPAKVSSEMSHSLQRRAGGRNEAVAGASPAVPEKTTVKVRK